MPHQLIYSARARRQLDRIEAYIAGFGFPVNAEEYIEQIYRRCQRIATAPYQGTRRDDLSRGVRTTGFDHRVTIIFRVDAHRVTILSFSYAGQRTRLK